MSSRWPPPTPRKCMLFLRFQSHKFSANLLLSHVLFAVTYQKMHCRFLPGIKTLPDILDFGEKDSLSHTQITDTFPRLSNSLLAPMKGICTPNSSGGTMTIELEIGFRDTRNSSDSLSPKLYSLFSCLHPYLSPHQLVVRESFIHTP